jgi:hypothetical protein
MLVVVLIFSISVWCCRFLLQESLATVFAAEVVGLPVALGT